MIQRLAAVAFGDENDYLLALVCFYLRGNNRLNNLYCRKYYD
jgi:hypothetical protein